MKKCLVVIGVVLLAGFLGAQTLTDSELTTRLNLNKNKFDKWDRGGNLEEKARTLNKDIAIKKIVMESPLLCDKCEAPDPSNHPAVKRATTASDLVVLGKVIKNFSSLTQNSAFVFTDSEFVIDDIWKNQDTSDTLSPIQIGSEITIVNPGGTVSAQGHSIHVSLSNLIPLQAGHRYLMYLKYLPDSHSYAPQVFDGFDITESSVSYLRTTLLPPAQELMNNRDLFLQAMHNSTVRGIEENSK